MLVELPPGPAFLLSRLPRALAPFFAAYAFAELGAHFTAPATPWIFRSGAGRALLLILALPLSAAVRIWVGELRKRREAAALGAVPPPVEHGKLPGNVDVLIASAKMAKTGYIGDILVEKRERLGNTFNIRVFWEDKIVTSEPEIVKAVLATNFNNFEKGSHSKFQMQDLLGDGVFNADGDMWKFHRSMTRPFFSRERISHFELFGRHADTALASARERARAGVAIDIQDLVSRFTLDSATEFLFGHCVHALRAPLPCPSVSTSTSGNESEKLSTHTHDKEQGKDAATRFAEAFASAQLAAAKRGRFNSAWPLFEFWKSGTADAMGIIDAYIDPILREAVAKKHASGPESSKVMDKEREIEDGDTLLDHLIHQTEDTKVLKDEILNIMIAGRDTTAALLTYAIYCLAENPELYTRLREEVLSVLGSERSPTYEDLREMKYLRAVLNETLRLYPPVPFDQRSSIEATTVPNPTPGAKPWYVPAHTRVIYSVLIMHRRQDLWGPDAHIFDPARFLDDRVSTYLTPNPFIFLPFNAGPRICLGQQFAYNEAGFMLARFMQAFSGAELCVDAMPKDAMPPQVWARASATERKKTERIWPKSHLTLFVQGGLWVRLHEASPVETA